ncbi:MAG: hypothetical protein IJT41_03685 [Clostridia bacterium]|nr:hypothetical protein [Clostridia bacterium]
MLLKQISVFLENKSGQLLEIVNLLAANGIDLRALSIAEAQDYGVLRIIVDKPDETLSFLRQQEWVCQMNEVLAVTVPDEPGSLTRILTVLADKNVNMVYTYAFLSGTQGKACIVLRVDDNAYAEKLLRDAGIEG